MAESKLLDFNLDKTCIIIIGSKKFRKKISDELKVNPILFYDRPIKLVESEKYLGDFIGLSLSESVFITVLKRKGMGERLIREIKVTVEDCRNNSVGGLVTGIEIWNMAVMPFLFSNCECWIDIPKKAMNILSNLQCSFLRSLYATPKGCPTMALFWDSGTLLVQNYIILRKLMFLHHLIHLPDSALAKQIYNKQKEKVSESEFISEAGFGFVSECESFMLELEISNDPSSVTKTQWRKMIHSRVHDKNARDILSKVQSLSKLDFDKLKNEEYGLQPYMKSMTVPEARTNFAVRARMLSSVMMNFKNNPEYRAREYRCGCGEEDHQAHLTSCSLYTHLQEGLNLETDIGLVQFYQLVITEREKEMES